MHSPSGQYAPVNGLQLYYEIHGQGYPLVLLHGGGSTIQSTFGHILPELAKNHKIIAIELQAHGRTADIDRHFTFEQDADDVAELLRQLQIKKSNVMGFSNGGTTSLQVAIRHPELVNKLVLISALYQRNGMIDGFWDGMQQATFASMPQPLKDAFLHVNPDMNGLYKMFERDKNRMLAFKDIPETAIRSIQAPALIINGNADVVRPEHAFDLSKLLLNARVEIIKGGHGDFIGESCAPHPHSEFPSVTNLIVSFLNTE